MDVPAELRQMAESTDGLEASWAKVRIAIYEAAPNELGEAISKAWNKARELNDPLPFIELVLAERISATEKAAKLLSENDIWLLASAAENLRGGSQNEERRSEAAWRIAPKLDDLSRRIGQLLKQP